MIRPHRISDWNVFYGMTGKTDYAKQMGKFVLARLLFEILIVLPFRILILLPLYLTGITLENHTKQQESIKRSQIKKIERAQKVLLQLEKLMPEISTADTKATRKSKTMRALTLLDELERLGQKEVVYDFEQVNEVDP
ncbi:hypothetical protein [Desulfofustis glycolicus]|uniref:Uncharacterized protein n=1 Tax=Desulfofustis glycolicus DSM 9705 TaxID=1121409 RepID=A0A1M5YWI8_9BACT|nr:hypothetical protein [Desulfofustis glycolicus]SHI16355.1 hypothetical protein SAMN02745124_04517 [Desulfofustis glycolicus DSM 9705]